MTDSLSNARPMDVTGYGFSQDDLPDLDHGPIDLHRWFGFGESAASAQETLAGAGGKPGELAAESSGDAGVRAGALEDGGAEAGAAGVGAGESSQAMDLEIGSGKGTFLAQQAGLEPGVDFLGVEWAKAFWRHAADRARRHAFPNVRLLWADATVFVRNYVGDATLRRVHIYFPDPWPKKRHHKRRSVQAPFLRELHRVLQPGGEIRLATDHAEYFEWMQDHAQQVDDLFERRPFERPDSAGEGELVGTNFERKYRLEGRPFHAMVLRKR